MIHVGGVLAAFSNLLVSRAIRGRGHALLVSQGSTAHLLLRVARLVSLLLVTRSNGSVWRIGD